MKPSGKSYIANLRLHHEGTQCTSKKTLYVSFSSDTLWRWPKTTSETRRSVFCSWYAPSVGYDLVLCLSLTWNVHNTKRFTGLLCKGEKRLRHYTRHSEPANHTNIDDILNRIRKKSRTQLRTNFNVNVMDFRHATWRTYLLIYLLTPWSRVVLEKLTGFQLVKKFPTFYGTRKFITAFTSAPHLSLSWASSIHSIPPHPTSWRSILILSFHLFLGPPSDLFPSDFPTKTVYKHLPSTVRATCSVHLILLDLTTRTIFGEHKSFGSSAGSFLYMRHSVDWKRRTNISKDL